MKESVKLIDQGQCEKCESLAHELAEVKRENEQLRAILSDESLEAMHTAAFNTSQIGAVAPSVKSAKDVRYIKTQLAVNDRIFAQRQALVEFPLKTDQTKARTENVRARTALAQADTRLKDEKSERERVDRLLKEEQTRFLGAASLALERYAQTGNMVEADFEVIDQLKQIGVKIPTRLAKNFKKL